MWVDKLELVPKDTEAPFMTLSGGNQQKVVLARALRLNPHVLILDEPTQGVDVGARAAIHKIVLEAARRGAGVLVISTESEELIALSNRVIVLVHGQVLGTFAARHLTAPKLTELTMREDIVPRGKGSPVRVAASQKEGCFGPDEDAAVINSGDPNSRPARLEN